MTTGTLLSLADNSTSSSTATVLNISNSQTGSGYGINVSSATTGSGYGVYSALTTTANTGSAIYATNATTTSNGSASTGILTDPSNQWDCGHFHKYGDGGRHQCDGPGRTAPAFPSLQMETREFCGGCTKRRDVHCLQR